jgi:hypothetical protein
LEVIDEYLIKWLAPFWFAWKHVTTREHPAPVCRIDSANIVIQEISYIGKHCAVKHYGKDVAFSKTTAHWDRSFRLERRPFCRPVDSAVSEFRGARPK